MNFRLLIAIVTSLLDEALILAGIFWGLPKLGIHVPWPLQALLVLLVAVYAVVTYRLGSNALRRKPAPGFTSMAGLNGKVTRRLAPEGMVRIKGEFWQATADGGPIEAGSEVIVTGQEGLMLTVKTVAKSG